TYFPSFLNGKKSWKEVSKKVKRLPSWRKSKRKKQSKLVQKLRSAQNRKQLKLNSKKKSACWFNRQTEKKKRLAPWSPILLRSVRWTGGDLLSNITCPMRMYRPRIWVRSNWIVCGSSLNVLLNLQVKWCHIRMWRTNRSIKLWLVLPKRKLRDVAGYYKGGYCVS